jgi:hypothetical protein
MAAKQAVEEIRVAAPFLAGGSIHQMCSVRPPMGLRDHPSHMAGLAEFAGQHGRIPVGFNATHAARGRNATGVLCAAVAEALVSSTRSPYRVHYRNCAVVGSGGGLRGSRDGREIDSHEAVFRFNTAELGPAFADDVGNRTTIWVASHSPWRMHMGARNNGASMNADVVLYCFNPWLGRCHADVLSLRPSQPPALMINSALISTLMRLQRRFARSTAASIRPSSGLAGVALAVCMCDVVTLFGFGNVSDPQSSGTCKHYWECRSNQTTYFSGRMRNHDGKAQWAVLASLIELGAVNYRKPPGD